MIVTPAKAGVHLSTERLSRNVGTLRCRRYRDGLGKPR